MTKFNRALFAIIAVLLAMTLSLSVLAEDSSVADESVADTSSEVSTDESADVSVDESAEESKDESKDESQAESKEESKDESKEESKDESTVSSDNSVATSDNSGSDNNSNNSGSSTKSNFHWARIITLIVIVVLILAAVILSKTNTKLGLRINKFFKEYWSEMKKVSWSSPKDTLKATGVVLVFLIVAAAVIGLLDLGFTLIIKKIAEIFN